MKILLDGISSILVEVQIEIACLSWPLAFIWRGKIDWHGWQLWLDPLSAQCQIIPYIFSSSSSSAEYVNTKLPTHLLPTHYDEFT